MKGLHVCGSQQRPCPAVNADVELDVVEHALGELAQAPDRIEAGRGLSDRAGIESGRREPRHHPGFGDRPLQCLTHEIGLPPGDVNQALERDPGRRRAPQRERDQFNGAAENLDRHVLTCVGACPGSDAPEFTPGGVNVGECWEKCLATSCPGATDLVLDMFGCVQNKCGLECAMGADACNTCAAAKCPEQLNPCLAHTCPP